MDYKDTLLLPKTDFPMRGNLPQNEPKIYERWQKDCAAYHKMRSLRATNTHNPQRTFTLHDGPPYANGNLHIGHALNKILKDIVIKTHFFNGDAVRYTPGWDCHGLPIEQQVEKSLGKDAQGKAKKDTLPKSKIRELCRAHAAKYLAIQADEFKQMGVLGDFENPYKTMDFAFEANIYRTLCEVAKRGLLATRSKPIFWSWAARSALAEAEVEYKDKEDYSIFVGFSLTQESKQKLSLEPNKEIKAVIWTTTPWTLLSNQAIALNPNEIYVITEEGYLLAKPLLDSLINKGITKGEILKEIYAKELEYCEAINPLNERKSVILLGEHVLMEGGSGLVHTAPGHGEDDYFLWLKYADEAKMAKYNPTQILMPVNDKGCYDESVCELLPSSVANDFVGLHIFKANEKILELLGENLISCSKFVHSYPHCWRTHEPVIYRATKQWFILMDKPFLDGKSLREVALKAIDETRFYPASGRNRINAMIENRPDWCISRQRDWGVPIAFFIDKESGEPLLDEAVLESIAKTFEKEGCDAWWDKEIEELLPSSHKSQAHKYEKCEHILDVWFDSGSTWNAVLKSGIYDAGEYPSDMYLEGSDQHRGWFQSSLLLSCALQGRAPYKAVLTHGFTMDANGQKMSKSKGNVVLPQEVLKQYGSEILRLWVALSDYQNDQKISNDILKQVSEQYKKIRNTIRFLMANVSDLDCLAKESDLGQIDRFILSRAFSAFGQARAHFKEYNFISAMQILSYFISNELSGIYLDLCKDSLYCDEKNGKERVAHQSVMAVILSHLCHLLAPVLTYTIEEALSFAPKILGVGGEFGVFEIASLESYKEIASDRENVDFTLLLELRNKFNETLDSLKKDGVVKSGLELCVVGDFGDFKESAKWLIVSEEGKKLGEKIATIEIEGKIYAIHKSGECKCERCWRYMASSSGGLCERCEKIAGK